MKKISSVKIRITIWYAALMLVMIAVVLTSVGVFSYQLSIDNVEKDIILQVTKVSEKFGKRDKGGPESIDSGEEFKNVSVHAENGDYIAGRYVYDIAGIEFKEGKARRETVDGKEYIVYDVLKRGAPDKHNGVWIRGAESVNSTVLLGRSAVVVTLVIIPVILCLTVLGGYLITKKAFEPVNVIIKTADKIAENNDIKQRIKIASGARTDELYALSVTLNNMLDKIEGLIIKEKRFTSDASHELRTPISVILAEGEYLLDIAKGEKEKELAKNIVDKAKQVSRLVSKLLLLARIDRNGQKISREKVDLSVLLDIAASEGAKKADEKDILVLTNVEENTIIEADEALLLSAVSNLIDNGIKYGKRSGFVSVSAEKIGGKTEITVRDNGIGISEENIGKIWDRFFRVDDVRNDEYESAGLGLSVVKSIVELHGGTVNVKSEPGEGTVFTIVL